MSDRIRFHLHENLDFFKNEPTFGLKEYPFKVHWNVKDVDLIKVLGEGDVIAGGSLVGEKFGDIDIFFVGKVDK